MRQVVAALSASMLVATILPAPVGAADTRAILQVAKSGATTVVATRTVGSDGNAWFSVRAAPGLTTYRARYRASTDNPAASGDDQTAVPTAVSAGIGVTGR